MNPSIIEAPIGANPSECPFKRSDPACNGVQFRCQSEDHDDCSRYLVRILARTRPSFRRLDPCLDSK